VGKKEEMNLNSLLRAKLKSTSVSHIFTSVVVLHQIVHASGPGFGEAEGYLVVVEEVQHSEDICAAFSGQAE
jgi:hypothetical protein